MVCGQADILRTVASDGLQGGVLQVELGRRVCARRVLQFHTQKRTECGAGQGVGAVNEEVVEGEGKGREECDQESKSRTDKEEILGLGNKESATWLYRHEILTVRN